MKNDRIKVCHFTTVHKRTDVRVFYKQCVSLSEAGYDVHLVVADGKGDACVNKVKIHDVGKMPNRLFRMVVSPIKMLNLLIALKCSIYQFHDPELLPMSLLLKLLIKAKVIYDSHECYADYFLHKDYLPKVIRPFCSKAIRAIEQFVGKRLDWVIVTTEYHEASLKGINKHLDIIYNYPLLSEWDNVVPSDNSIKKGVCYIGNITEERGITQLIRAIEKVDCVLHLAGDYEPREYRQELTRLPGWEKVIEYGYVNRQQAAEIISKSLLGVVLFLPKPIHYTSLSTKVFEYMAGGIACLVSDFPIWQNIVSKYNCGICVNPLDTEQIAKQISYLLQNPDVANAMGEQGKKKILDEFNWETQEPKLFNIYRTLLVNNP